MTPREELELLELEAKASGQPVAPESSFSGDAVKGLKASIDRSALGIKGLLPKSVQDFGDRVDAAMGSGGLTKETAVKAPDTAGGLTGSIGGEVLQMVVPGGAVLKGGKVLQRALAARGAAGTGAAAMVGADIGGNAAVSAAMEPEDRGTAAAWGGAGAAGGRVLARTLGGAMRESVSPQAQRLIDAGVHITPGQALTGPQAGIVARTIRGAEDKITSIPLVGDVIANAQQRGLRSFNMNRINDALEPIGAKIKHAGVEGLDAADQHISDAYDKVIPHIFVEPGNALTKITEAQARWKSIPLFDDIHKNKLDQYIDRHIMPVLAAGGNVPGEIVKRIDAEIGKLGRELSAKGGLTNGPIGDGFLELRRSWRQAMEGVTPEARQGLTNADKAFAKLVPLLKAGEKKAEGIFTPKQLADSLRQSKMKPDQLTEAARQVLPNTVPDSGTAGRQIFGRLISPEAGGAGAGVAAAGLGGLGPAAIAALGAGAMYTKTGLKALTGGVHPLIEALRSKLTKKAYDPSQIEDILRNLSGRSITATGTE